ncbi:MAG: hypothetical protein WDZ49_12770 [Litorilinea sp.]
MSMHTLNTHVVNSHVVNSHTQNEDEQTRTAHEAHTRWRLAVGLLLITLFSLVLVQPAQAQSYQTISYGDQIYNIVTTSHGDNWYFQGVAGETVAVRMNSSQFDTYLEVYSPNGSLICWDDDSGGNYDAYIAACRLPSTGNFTVVARGYSGATGHYGMDFQRVGAPWPPAVTCTDGRQIGYGSRVSGSVTCSEGSHWTFYGSRGEWVEIIMRSDSMDTYLELLDPNGHRIAWDDDGAGNLNSRIYLNALPTSGRYTIVARGYAGDMGTYQLSLD